MNDENLLGYGSSPWPFEQPQDCAVITLKSIILDAAPILHVSHDQEDDCWQFLDGNIVKEEDAMVVSLDEIVNHDQSLLELADLPPGWYARRDSSTLPWKRYSHSTI